MKKYGKLLSIRWLLTIAAITAIVACIPQFPAAPSEDNGDYSYARQIVPTLYGRKIRGYAETKLLHDYIGATNRTITTRALMAQSEFTDYWSEVLVNDLRIAREDPSGLGGSPQSGCFSVSNVAASNSTTLAATILNSTPQTAYVGGSVSMGDVVRSSVHSDDLFPVYRAHIYSLTRQPNNGIDELQQRENFGTQFDEVFLNRQIGCLTCHNSFASTTDTSSGWNRHFPITGLFEKALWGSNTGIATDRAHAMYRSQFGGLQPWSITPCGSFNAAPGNDPNNKNAYFTQAQGVNFGLTQLQSIFKNGRDDIAQNGMKRTLEPAVQQQCNFCANNCQGNTTSWQLMTNNATNAAQIKTLVTTTCAKAGCHGSSSGTGAAGMGFPNTADWAIDLQTRVTPGNANTSLMYQRVGIQKNMPPGAPLAQTQIDQIAAWINSMPSGNQCAACGTVDCNGPRNFVTGPDAFAYLVAERVANNVWNEVQGGPLTIANYFSRNQGQRDVLWNLTEGAFLPNDWSLHAVIERIVTSNYFNRKPPQTTSLSSSYVLWPIADPWTVADPRIPPVSDAGYDPNAHPENHLNAMSENVHRYSAWSLTNSVHSALDWPAPQRFPSAVAAYPSISLLRSIGFHFSDVQPGNRLVDFQGLLAWETTHGQCHKPSGVGTDWINRLITGINNFNTANPGSPLSVGDVVTVMRDWLLGYGAIGTTIPVGLSATEEDAVKTHFGVAALSDPIGGVADLETHLRDLCGMQLQSPQFQLAGITPEDLGTPPRFRVCNGGPCTYKEMCQALAPAIAKANGKNTIVVCGDDSVNVSVINLPTPPVWVDFCPPGLCGVLDRFVNKGCPIMAVGGDPTQFVVGGGAQPINQQTSGGQPNIGGNVGVTNAIAARNAIPFAATRPTRGAFFARDFCPNQPPQCDPRCSRIDCCGGPGLPPGGLQAGDMLVTWADGARVREAGGVRILPAGQNQFVDLEKGRELRSGDLLALQPGSSIALATREGKVLRTPEGGMPKAFGADGALMMISGEQALQQRDVVLSPADRAAAHAEIQRAMKVQSRLGEAGQMLTAEQIRQYKYPTAELEFGNPKKRPPVAQPLKKADKQ